MKQDFVVSDFMTDENIVVAAAHNTFSEVLGFFATHKIQHMPVVENNLLIGIVSINDMLHAVEKALKQSAPVSHESLNTQFPLVSLMTANPVSVNPNTPVHEAIRLLQDGKFQCLPVTENGEVRGIITNKDFVRIFSKDLNPPHNTFKIETPGFGI